MPSKYIEVFIDKERTRKLLICLNNVLYFAYKNNDYFLVYLVDGTYFKVYESYKSLSEKLLAS